MIEAKPAPTLQTFLGTIDQGARATMVAARGAVQLVVEAETPHRSGEMAHGLRPRVGRTGTGQVLTVGATRGAKDGEQRLSDVVRWVTRGTGRFRQGPGPKRAIRAKHPLRRMVLPGGARRWSVQGQHPNPFMLRIRELATPKVKTICDEGARETVQRLQRTIR